MIPNVVEGPEDWKNDFYSNHKSALSRLMCQILGLNLFRSLLEICTVSIVGPAFKSIVGNPDLGRPFAFEHLPMASLPYRYAPSFPWLLKPVFL
jgi:hypothetical protein